MEEVTEGEAQRAAMVFEAGTNGTNAVAAEMAADQNVENEVTALNDLMQDEEFDVVDAIMEAPPEFIADEEVADAFESILQSNGVDADDIEMILAQQPVAGVEAQSGAAPEAVALTATDDAPQTVEPVAGTDVDEGDETALDVFNAGVGDGALEAATPDPALIDNANADAGVEAQTGAVEQGQPNDTTDSNSASGCPGADTIDDMVAGDDQTTADNTAAMPDGEAGVMGDSDATADDQMGMADVMDVGSDAEPTFDDTAADDAAMSTATDGGCDLSMVDWTTPGANGLSLLGEVVQMFQELVEATGLMMPVVPDSDICQLVAPCSMDAMMNDAADLDVTNAMDPVVVVDEDM